MSAIESGRKLTTHEWDVFQNWNDPRSVPDVSVAHILGSGLVQNLLNRMILQFRDGEAISRGEEADARRRLIQGLAMQAAAIGCMRGIGRAIIEEEPVAHGYGEELVVHGYRDEPVEHADAPPATSPTQADKRRLMAQDIDVALGNVPAPSQRMRSGRESRRDTTAAAASSPAGGRGTSAVTARNPERQEAYLSYLMHTVDSPGNLRLGSRQGNSIVGAGFDMPLTEEGKPTKRGLRLYAALKAYGPPDMEECRKLEVCGDTYHTGHFTIDKEGHRLSSSKQVSDRLNDQAVEQIMQARLTSRL
ncbi:hypothetical protein ACUSIJ_19750 [Pseudochelatococcus sp. B33]